MSKKNKKPKLTEKGEISFCSRSCSANSGYVAGNVSFNFLFLSNREGREYSENDIRVEHEEYEARTRSGRVVGRKKAAAKWL